MIIVKLEPNYYTHDEFIQATDGSSVRYFNLYTVNSGWNGWNINFLPLKGGILNGEVYINGGYARFVSDNKTLQLETRNGINNTSNRRMLYFRNSSYKDITESLVLGDMVDNVQKNIFNIWITQYYQWNKSINIRYIKSNLWMHIYSI